MPSLDDYFSRYDGVSRGLEGLSRDVKEFIRYVYSVSCVLEATAEIDGYIVPGGASPGDRVRVGYGTALYLVSQGLAKPLEEDLLYTRKTVWKVFSREDALIDLGVDGLQRLVLVAIALRRGVLQPRSEIDYGLADAVKQVVHRRLQRLLENVLYGSKPPNGVSDVEKLLYSLIQNLLQLYLSLFDPSLL